MNTTRLLEIAAQLAATYARKAEKAISLANANRDLELALLTITPAEGWPGKNAEERKLASERAAADNQTVIILRGIIREQENELTAIQAGIDGLEAERRALEWEIRAQLAWAVRGQQNEPGVPVDYSAFDDVSQDALDNQVVEDIPF